MPRGYTDDDPAKGAPHRRVREKIRLLLEPVADDALALRAVISWLADKRPELVLDALVWVVEAADAAAVPGDDMPDGPRAT